MTFNDPQFTGVRPPASRRIDNSSRAVAQELWSHVSPCRLFSTTEGHLFAQPTDDHAPGLLVFPIDHPSFRQFLLEKFAGHPLDGIGLRVDDPGFAAAFVDGKDAWKVGRGGDAEAGCEVFEDAAAGGIMGEGDGRCGGRRCWGRGGSAALRNQGQPHLSALPPLADAAVWALAAASDLQIDPAAILQAFRPPPDPLVEKLVTFMESRDSWKGPGTHLAAELALDDPPNQLSRRIFQLLSLPEATMVFAVRSASRKRKKIENHR